MPVIHKLTKSSRFHNCSLIVYDNDVITILYYCTEMSTETWTHVTIRSLPAETCPESVEVCTITRSTRMCVCVCVCVCVRVCVCVWLFIFHIYLYIQGLFTVYTDIRTVKHTNNSSFVYHYYRRSMIV